MIKLIALFSSTPNLPGNVHLPDFAWNIIIIASALLSGFIIKWILALLVKHYARKQVAYSFYGSVLRHLSRPFTFFLPLLVLNMCIPMMYLPPTYLATFSKAVEIALTLVFAWILIKSMSVGQDYVFFHYDLKQADNLKSRKVRTQLQFMRQLLTAVIIILTIAAILLSFSSMRKIGAGLLTGVGVGGIIIGFAAQKSLSNLLAGFQIAFTQPIRIDDVLVVEGEWGRVEEITLTYVVLRIWDQRRLILPINYFIENPFQNWTRTSAEILGTAFIYTDYSVPVDKLREEFTRLLKSNQLWDGKVNVMHVTDLRERTMEIRALMSASDSGKAFDLRCYIRENMIAYIQEHFPESLAKTRIEITGPESNKS